MADLVFLNKIIFYPLENENGKIMVAFEWLPFIILSDFSGFQSLFPLSKTKFKAEFYPGRKYGVAFSLVCVLIELKFASLAKLFSIFNMLQPGNS